MEKFGTLFAKIRKEARLNIEEVALSLSVGNAYITRMERNEFMPPTGEDLDRFLTALGLEEGSNDWIQLINYAYLDRGEIPPYALKDQDIIQRLFNLATRHYHSDPDELKPSQKRKLNEDLSNGNLPKHLFVDESERQEVLGILGLTTNKA